MCDNMKQIVKASTFRFNAIEQDGKSVEYTNKNPRAKMMNYIISITEYNKLGKPAEINVTEKIEPYPK